MAQFTIEGYNNKLKGQLAKLNRGDLVEIAARTSMVEMVKRIFERGGNSFGGLIGQYESRKEIYLDNSMVPTGHNHIGKRGKKIKTNFYTSYKEFKKSSGRTSNRIVPINFGRLQLDFSNGKSATPIKITNLEFIANVKDEENEIKANGLQKRFGAIFEPTPKERSTFLQELDLQFAQLLDA